MKGRWVLWGYHPAYAPVRLKVTAGPLGACRSELRYRKALGWSDLSIVKDVNP